MLKNKIVLTEQDLHTLVEDAVKTLIINEGIEEDVLGGIKNAWHGAFGKNDQGQRNWNFNFGQTYRSGDLASSFDSYLQQIGKAIQGMQQIAIKSGNQEINNDLDEVFVNLQNISIQFKNQATNVANGNQKNMWIQNPWETQRNMQQNQFNDQMQALQNKYNRLNTRYKNYKKKNPYQTNGQIAPSVPKVSSITGVPAAGTAVPGKATTTSSATTPAAAPKAGSRRKAAGA